MLLFGKSDIIKGGFVGVGGPMPKSNTTRFSNPIQNEILSLMTKSQRANFNSYVQSKFTHKEDSLDIGFYQLLHSLLLTGPAKREQKERIMDWDEWFFEIAKTVAKKSKVPYAKVGCIVVGPDHEMRATGYNGFPRGVDDYRMEWYDNPAMYQRLLCAEANAVAHASFTGTSLKRGIAYSTAPPDAYSAGLFVNAGIVSCNFIVPLEADPERQDEYLRKQLSTALDIFRESGVDIVAVSGEWDEDGEDPKEMEVRKWIYAVTSPYRLDRTVPTLKEVRDGPKDGQEPDN
jgi:dCMP deaminase